MNKHLKNKFIKSNSFNIGNQNKFNKTFKKLFDNPINKDKNKNKITPEFENFENIHFIKNPNIDKEIEALHDRHINDEIFTNAVKNLSYDNRKDILIRGVNKKQTIYGMNLKSDKILKKESFILKNYFPIYLPDILAKNRKKQNKKAHYSKNIVKTLNNKLFSLFSQDSMRPLGSLDFNLFEKKFEEEVKSYQLSKIIQLNNMMHNNNNIIMLNNLEDIEKKNFEDNIGCGQLFFIRENNFNEKEINEKLESNKLKLDLKIKEKKKSKDINIFNKSKFVKKKKNKEVYSLFNKKDLKKSKEIYNDEEGITNFELKIYYCQNLSTGNKNKEEFEGINQDSFLQILSINGNKKFHLFGIMDGHGINGHIISKYVSRFIEEFFISETTKKILNNCKNNEEIYALMTNKNYFFINNLISECHKSLINNTQYDCKFSGCACLLIFLIGNKLICANIGDGRAILLEKTELLQLSIEQTLKDPEELKRIINKGGKINKIKNKIILDMKEIDNFEISRTIGDKDLKDIGIIYEPVISEYELSKKSRFLIMGTKGFWKGLTNEKAAIQVNKSIKLNNPLDCCRLLEKKAEDNIFKSSSYRDDMTIIVIIFEETDNNFIKNAVYK